MTLLTPNFAEKVRAEEPSKGNGAAQPEMHVVASHEPLKENSQFQADGNGALHLATPDNSLPPNNAFQFAQPAVGYLPQSVATVIPNSLEQKEAQKEPAPLKIALIGTAPSSRMLAPFNDQSWKIWACSPGNQGSTLPRVDAWFELHANLMWPEYKHYGEPYLKWLSEQKFPIYMQDKRYLANAVVFPKDEMVKEYGPYFFTSSFSWMMAYAISQGAKEVALFGIDMASHQEYILQRPGAYYFMIRGAERGCKVWAPYESDIMQPPGLYGYSEVTQMGRKTLARKAELQQRITPMEQQHAQIAHDLAYLKGAMENMLYYEEIHIGAQDNSHSGYLDQLFQKAVLPQQTSLTQGSQG